MSILFLGLAIAHQSKSVVDSAEVRGLLLSLDPRLDDYSKNMILHGITRCIYLLDTEVRVRNCKMYSRVVEKQAKKPSGAGRIAVFYYS